MKRKGIKANVIVGVALFVFKIFGIIHWPWLLVLLPFYWPVPLFLGLGALALIGIPVADTIRKVFGNKPTTLLK